MTTWQRNSQFKRTENVRYKVGKAAVSRTGSYFNSTAFSLSQPEMAKWLSALAANLAMDHLDGPQISPFAKFCSYLLCRTDCNRTQEVTVSCLVKTVLGHKFSKASKTGRSPEKAKHETAQAFSMLAMIPSRHHHENCGSFM